MRTTLDPMHGGPAMQVPMDGLPSDFSTAPP